MMKPTDEQLIDLLGRVVLEFGDYDEITGELKPFQREVINAVSSAADLLEEGDRPTKPAAPEWVDGLPPVGSTENECAIRGLSKTDSFEVIAHRDGKAIVYFKSYPVAVTTVAPDEFRPIPTAEQRQREELANEISKAAHRLGFTLDLNESDKLSDAAIKFFEERYNLEPKP